jgi:hypothetical protein
VRAASNGSPLAVKAPTGAVVLGAALVAVNSTWVTMYWRGEEQIN